MKKPKISYETVRKNKTLTEFIENAKKTPEKVLESPRKGFEEKTKKRDMEQRRTAERDQ